MTGNEFRERLVSEHPGTRLQKLTADVEARLRERYPWLPEDYFALLSEVGWGGIGNSRYMIYQGPMEPDKIYDSVTAAELAGVVLVGDDFAGACEAFANRGSRCIFGYVDEHGDFQPHIEARFIDFLVSLYGADNR